jgi:hypothetical protein
MLRFFRERKDHGTRANEHTFVFRATLPAVSRPVLVTVQPSGMGVWRARLQERAPW